MSSSSIQASVILVRTNRHRSQGEGKHSEKAVVMPKRKRLRRERTHDWQEIQQYTLWYEVLKRWATEGHAGLDDKPSSAPHHPARKATLSAINEVRKLAEESPELCAYRVHVA